jgi:hypothetical protein
MSIEIHGNPDDGKTHTYFAFCNSCDDINEEDGDPRPGPLQLSGDGTLSLFEVKEQATLHEGAQVDKHRIVIDVV